MPVLDLEADELAGVGDVAHASSCGRCRGRYCSDPFESVPSTPSRRSLGRRLERRVPHLHDLHDEVHADLEQRRDVGLHRHDVLDADDEVVVGDADLGEVELEAEVVAALQPQVQVVGDLLADQPLPEDPHHRPVAVQAAHEQLLRRLADHERHVAVTVDVGVEPEILEDVENPTPQWVLVRRRWEVRQAGGVAHAPSSMGTTVTAPYADGMSPPAPPRPLRDLPPPPGITRVEGGVELCVYAGHADTRARLPVRRR